MIRRILFFSLTFFYFYSLSLIATEYWTPQQLREFESAKKTLNIRAIPPTIEEELKFKYRLEKGWSFSYPAEFVQIAHFLAQWQVTDPTSPDYGGMIEAEGGQLGNVIQTDNTQEAIVVWCQYGTLTGDTATFRPNIDAAWIYIMNYPAYNEEGSTGSDYYRDHNCAWALWGVEWYETVYQDTSYRWYADSCANYMTTHQLYVFDPESNLNAFVMGWMAGNLYHYGQWRGNTAWMDSALVMGNKVLNWANADPLNHLSDFTWAMSSGTAVWGLCESVFKADSLAGVAWLQSNAAYLPLYFDNSDPGAYVWDSAWNVALANAYRSMHPLTANPLYNQFHHLLTDTLLALDVDDDGGIMANKNHPPDEDMSWVSAYLNVMGVDYRIAQSPQTDAGVVRFAQPDTSQIYLVGDTLSVQVEIANFGFQPLQGVQLTLYANSQFLADTTIDLPFTAMQIIDFPRIMVVQNSGPLTLIAKTQIPGDENPDNDQFTTTLPIPFFIHVRGIVSDAETGQGVGGTIVFYHPQRTFQTTISPATGEFQLQLIPGVYSGLVDTDFPYQQFSFDSLRINEAKPPVLHWITRRGDLILIDDDEGAEYERFYLEPLQEIFSGQPDYPWQACYHWDVNRKGLFPVSRIYELKHPYVIWYTGDADSTALTLTEQDSLQWLLNSGASVLLTGKNIAESLQGTAFLHQVLSAEYAGNSTYFPKFVYGVTGDPVSDSLRFTTWGGPGANNQLYDRDIINPLPPAQTIFHYLPQDSQSAGIRLENSAKLIFLGFGVEGIRDNYPGYDNRKDLLTHVLLYFNGNTDFPYPYSFSGKPHRFTLQPLYPNPFNSSLQIRFTLDRPQRVRVEVFDILGRRIARLLDEYLTSGEHSQTWNGKTVSSGIYYLRLKGEEKQQIRKAVLIK